MSFDREDGEQTIGGFAGSPDCDVWEGPPGGTLDGRFLTGTLHLIMI